MKIAVFTLPQVLAEKDPNTVINDRYGFKDGKLSVVEPIGRQIERILCVMYGCTVEWVDAEPQVNPDAPTGSLAKVVTQSNVKPLTESKTAAAVAGAQPDPNAVKSVVAMSVEDASKAAEAVKAEAAKPAPAAAK